MLKVELSLLQLPDPEEWSVFQEEMEKQYGPIEWIVSSSAPSLDENIESNPLKEDEI